MFADEDSTSDPSLETRLSHRTTRPSVLCLVSILVVLASAPTSARAAPSDSDDESSTRSPRSESDTSGESSSSDDSSDQERSASSEESVEDSTEASRAETNVEGGPDTAGDVGDTSKDGTDDLFSDAHRRELYAKSKLEYSRAALWTALLPGLGNFYAEQYLIGGLAMTFVGFTAVLVPFGLITEQPGYVWTGVGFAGTAYAGGFISSYVGVRTYNRRLRQRLRISSTSSSQSADGPRARLVPAPRGLSISISF